MASRRRARERALQMLFQWDISKDTPDNVKKLFWGTQGRGIARPPEIPAEELEDTIFQSFTNNLFVGTVKNCPEIDEKISAHADNWRLERMPAVDRNILRLGTYEMLHERETPAAVVINESLDIARKYSSDESVSFINGLLDKILKEAKLGEIKKSRSKKPTNPPEP